MCDKESLVGKELIYTCPFTEEKVTCELGHVKGECASVIMYPGSEKEVRIRVSIVNLSYRPKEALPLKVYLNGLTLLNWSV